jgi:probable phosphoglycerate mutase
MLITIARHGETLANENDILQGQLPGELSKKGWVQAEGVARALNDKHFDVIFSTDLKRGLDTARVIAQYHTSRFVLDPLLRERHFGVFQGTSRTRFYQLERALPDPAAHQPEGGESFADLAERARKFLKQIRVEFRGLAVLVASHGDVNRMLLGMAQNLTVQAACQIPQTNGCLNVVEMNHSGDCRVLKLNSIDHLSQDERSFNKTTL